MRRLMISCLVSLACVACGEEAATEPAAPAAEAAPAPAAAPAAEAAPAPTAAPAAEAAPAPAAAPAAAGEPTVVTLAALREGFAADRDAWMGRSVTVTALYYSSTSLAGELNNIALKADRGDGANSMCAFDDETRPATEPSLSQFTEVTVTGTVGEFFGSPKIEHCRIL